MKKIKVDKVILYYMDRVDPDGNPYRFYVYKGMASEIEYFCTEEAGNMTIPIGEGEYVKIVPKEIEKIPVSVYGLMFGPIKQNNFITLENDIMQINVGSITYI